MKIRLIHLYINTQKQVFRKCSKTYITGVKVDLTPYGIDWTIVHIDFGPFSRPQK